MHGPRDLRQWLSISGDYLIETPLDEHGNETMYSVLRWEEKFDGQGWWTTVPDVDNDYNTDFDTYDEAYAFLNQQEKKE